MALPTRVNRGSYDPFELAQREFDSLLRNVYGGRPAAAGGDGVTGPTPYGVDVREDADHIYVEAELPGFRKEDVDITLENQTLTITAQRSEQAADGNGVNGGQAGHGKPTSQANCAGRPPARPQGEWLLRERRYTRFQRSFTLPPTVDEATVNARLDHGVLTVTLNKREETKPRKIAVN